METVRDEFASEVRPNFGDCDVFMAEVENQSKENGARVCLGLYCTAVNVSCEMSKVEDIFGAVMVDDGGMPQVHSESAEVWREGARVAVCGGAPEVGQRASVAWCDVEVRRETVGTGSGHEALVGDVAEEGV